jgi:hypothetical protein
MYVDASELAGLLAKRRLSDQARKRIGECIFLIAVNFSVKMAGPNTRREWIEDATSEAVLKGLNQIDRFRRKRDTRRADARRAFAYFTEVVSTTMLTHIMAENRRAHGMAPYANSRKKNRYKYDNANCPGAICTT